MSWTASIVFRLKKVCFNHIELIHVKPNFFFPQKNVMVCCCKTIIKKKLFGRGVEIKQLDYVSLTATTFFRLKKFASTISSCFTSTIISKPRAEKKNTYGTWLRSLWALPWEMQMHCRIWLQTTGFHLEHLWQVKLVLQKTFKRFNRTGN